MASTSARIPTVMSICKIATKPISSVTTNKTWRSQLISRLVERQKLAIGNSLDCFVTENFNPMVDVRLNFHVSILGEKLLKIWRLPPCGFYNFSSDQMSHSGEFCPIRLGHFGVCFFYIYSQSPRSADANPN